MPSIDVVTPEPPNDAETEKTHLPVIGIIYPPPEVRNIVDKTASFVARNGPEFESRIRQNELGNPKFNFLNAGDPYHGYYQHKVKEFKEGKGQEPKSDALGPGIQSIQKPASQLKQQELLKQTQAQEQQQFELKDPPAEYEFIADPPSISALDLDIVKLTAQFVARNGRSFLTQLMNREQRNYQFDFLRPQHSLFQYFTKLLEQYTKILLPPKDLVGKLAEEVDNMHLVLDQAKYRAEWEKHQEAQRRKEEQIIERERIAYAQIDWHDFVVVETVDYQIGEVGNFPSPTTPDEVGARVLMQERGQDKKSEEKEGEDENEMQLEGSDDEMLDRTGGRESSDESEESDVEEKSRKKAQKAREGKDNTQVEDMEEESSEESEPEAETPQPPPDKKATFVPPLPPLPPTPDKVIIKKGYDPKLASKTPKVDASVDEMISPLTGTKIPASKVQEHMRIGLLDPRWVEQRDKHIKDKMNQESVYAPGAAIEASLKQLAERRTDIFGIGDEETAIGKKIGEEDTKKDDKITWDGHTSSVEAATRAARANITIEEQIHQIHKVKGLLPDEEKEKIGPKPVLAESKSSAVPPLPSAPPSSIPSSLPPLPSQPPLPPQPVSSTSASLSLRPPLPPAPPTLPTSQPPAPPVVLLPTGTVPSVPRPPILLPPQPQAAFSLIPPTAASLPPSAPQAGFLGASQTQSQTGTKHAASEKLEDEPAPKKARTEESLVPEDVFLANNQGPVKFKVVTPSMPEKPEWRLSGQILELTLPLTDSVSVIKAKIHEITNMPPGKQKIHWEGLFLKDSNSLAYYNITPSIILQLQLKERGGRKK